MGIISKKRTAVDALADWPVVPSAHRFGDQPKENSLEAYEKSIRLGYPLQETDVWGTDDGKLLWVVHDPNLDRVIPNLNELVGRVSLKVTDLTLELRDKIAKKTGWTIPLFSELREAIPHTVRSDLVLSVDCKNKNAVDLLAAEVDTHELHGNIIVAAFEQPIIDALRHRLPNVATSMSVDEVVRFAQAVAGGKRLPKCPAQFAQLPVYFADKWVITDKVMAAAREAKMRVYAWDGNPAIIDNPEIQARLIDEVGVDGLVVNDLGGLKGRLKARGLWKA